MSQPGTEKAMRKCPDCGANIREDRLARHAERCPKRAMRERRPAAQQAVSRKQQRAKDAKASAQSRRISCPYCGLWVLPRHYERHTQDCRQNPDHGCEKQAAAKRASAANGGAKAKTRYQIDRCWSCGRRVCLVPDGQRSFRVYEVTHDRKPGDLHLCDGVKSGGRRTKLTYLDSRAASVAPDDDKRSRWRF